MANERKPMAVFLTGAGLSADSGIPTFRGADGLYAGMRAEEVLSADTMGRAPELVHRFMDDRRAALRDVSPNPAHLALAQLRRDYGDRVCVLTQNIDDLLERAGLPDAVHLHGYLPSMRSIGNSKVTEDIGHARYWDGDPALAPPRGFRFRCPKSNSRFRPDVVLFGERAPLYAAMYRVLSRLEPDDVLVVIGTQGVVLPVSELVATAQCRTVLNNLHPSDNIDDALFDEVLRDRASTAAGRIVEIVRGQLGYPTDRDVVYADAARRDDCPSKGARR